jgi:hypothetical protein
VRQERLTKVQGSFTRFLPTPTRNFAKQEFMEIEKGDPDHE